jgi:hypothetical protein
MENIPPVINYYNNCLLQYGEAVLLLFGVLMNNIPADVDMLHRCNTENNFGCCIHVFKGICKIFLGLKIGFIHLTLF